MRVAAILISALLSINAQAQSSSPVDLLCDAPASPTDAPAPQIQADAENAVRRVIADAVQVMGHASLADAIASAVRWPSKDALTAENRRDLERIALIAMASGRMTSLFPILSPWPINACDNAATVPQASVMKVLRRAQRQNLWFQLNLLTSASEILVSDEVQRLHFLADLADTRELLVRADAYMGVPDRREPLMTQARARMVAAWAPLFSAMEDQAQQSAWSMGCQVASAALAMGYQQEVTPYLSYLSWSKPVVRGLEAAFYGPEVVAAAQVLYERVKASARQIAIEGILSRAELGTRDMERVIAELDALQLSLPRPVRDEDFRTIPQFPVPVLDFRREHLFQVQARGEVSRITMGMMEYFVPNAGFVTAHSVGAFAVAEHVEMNPAFLRSVVLNPDAGFFALSHELSHKFDPDTTITAGLPLGRAYENLFACFSTQMPFSDLQRGEMFADWMGTEIVARELMGEADPQMRRQRLRVMATSHCEWVRGDRSSLRTTPADYPVEFGAENWRPFAVHPEHILRLEFMFGRHPVIRRILGIEENMPYCGLGGFVDPVVTGTP